MTFPNRFSGGVVDLGEVKARAQQQQQAQQPRSGDPVAAGANPVQDGATVATFFSVTEENFETEVLHRSLQVPVIVMIGTARSDLDGPLQQDLRELASTGELRFLVGYVDADAQPQIAQALGVRNLPTVLALAAGRPLADFEGGQPRE
ncbi:MAG TPA: co-chaperone YbbN, partial [Corynebacterium sp.]|nr:co-chaperone YbbN [Corynebacterium sp.]